MRALHLFLCVSITTLCQGFIFSRIAAKHHGGPPLAFSYVPFVGLTGDADQEAETLEQSNSQDPILLLKAWRKAFDQNPSTDQETKVLEYGYKMEQILTQMEDQGSPSMDAYAIVLQMYVAKDANGRPGDPVAALRILSRMEHQLPQEEELPSTALNRLLLYNQVLEGLAAKSPVLCSLLAVPLLQAMARQTPVALPKDEQVDEFTPPPSVRPNIQSFVLVLEPLLRQNQKVNAYLKPICDLLRLAHSMELLLLGTLLGKMQSILQGDREHLEGLLLEAELEQFMDLDWGDGNDIDELFQ
jgi:hypothetical protein